MLRSAQACLRCELACIPAPARDTRAPRISARVCPAQPAHPRASPRRWPSCPRSAVPQPRSARWAPAIAASAAGPAPAQQRAKIRAFLAREPPAGPRGAEIMRSMSLPAQVPAARGPSEPTRASTRATAAAAADDDAAAGSSTVLPVRITRNTTKMSSTTPPAAPAARCAAGRRTPRRRIAASTAPLPALPAAC